MCGIIGIVGEKRPSISLALETLNKRGPDARGIEQFSSCTLGHTRLSIIDIANGAQPMRDQKHDVAITFNGEIYNYRELRRELVAKGHTFSTQSDTEVILRSYIEYGERCVEYLDGMFSLAIWNNRDHSLFLARDRFGKKPLYYAYSVDGNFMFGSEIKALFATNSLKGILNFEAIDNFLHLFYIPPNKTIYTNIFSLPPGHCALYTQKKLTVRPYWTLPIRPISIGFDEAKDQLSYLLNNAVKKRMVADVEVGTFLSGGVDSSIVTHLAQLNTQKPIKSFAAGFGQYINELPYAKEASRISGTDHNELQIGSDISLPNILTEICEYFDEPFADSSSVPQYLISKFAHSKVKVVLSGDGGDEAFLGYGWYWKWKTMGQRDRIKHPFASRNAYQYHMTNIQNFHPTERVLLWKNPLHVSAPLGSHIMDPRLSAMENINLWDFRMWLPGDILTKVDRMSMMNSLEVRSPFLDTALIEFAFNLPKEFKSQGNHGKIILKTLFEDVFGEEFMHRRKQGFSAPAKDWLKQKDFREFTYSTLTGSSVHIHALFRASYINTLLNLFYKKGIERLGYRIWILLCLELWLKSHAKYHV